MTGIGTLEREAIEASGLLTEAEPERYVRIAITKNSKGFTYETTVSIRGAISIDQVDRELRQLNASAYMAAHTEITQREALEEMAVQSVASRVETRGPVDPGSIPVDETDLPF